MANPPTTQDYMRGHRASGIKMGDRVRVLRKAQDFEYGWDEVWDRRMDSCVGRVMTVKEDGSDALGFLCGEWYFPYFVLEKVLEETKPSDVVDESEKLIPSKKEWKPEIGKECIWHYETRDIRVIPRMQCGEYVWIKESLSTDDCKGSIVKEHCLHPLSTVPPVSAGDYVAVITPNCDEHIGKVLEVNLEVKYLLLHRNGPRFFWDAVTITRLVPDTLYNRTKQRLEEKLREASRTESWRAWDYMMQLQRDLETYAKDMK